jgi:pimeloyl-ACP methyl ester carboxylesterase
VADARQVRRYLTGPGIRAAVQDRVCAAVSADTRVLVGHSLGSVVAYEALCANPQWPVQTLVTLGSPLGIRSLIFDRLAAPVPATMPAPAIMPDGRPPGAWPGGVTAWTNVADRGDVVALVKDLRPLFGDRLAGWLVDNGPHAHAVQPYLTAAETGAAIAAGLCDSAQPGTR